MVRTLLAAVAAAALSLVITSAHAAAPTHLWSKPFGSTLFDSGQAVAVDAAGNVFISGFFNGTVDFGGGPLVSAGVADIFLAKYNARGEHQWSKRFGGTLDDRGTSIAIDASGNVALTGYFQGTINFGLGNLVSIGGFDVFLARFTTHGAHLTSARYGSTGPDAGLAIAADASGNVFLTGYSGGLANFGGASLVNGGGNDFFVAKYNGSGAHVWSMSFGSPGNETGNAIAVDVLGTVLTTGVFSNTVDFGGGLLASAGGFDIFVAVYTTNGAHRWSQRFGSTGNETGTGIKADIARNVFVTGYFSDTVDFGGGNLTSAGDTDIFLAKYDPFGTHIWSERFGTAAQDVGSALAMFPDGGVVMSGYVFAGTDFGGGTLPGGGGQDGYIAAYNGGGAHRWSRQIASEGGDGAYAIAVDGDSEVLATGVFGGYVDFGGGVVPSSFLDVFLLKYDATPPEPAITSITDIGNDQGRTVNIRFERSGADNADAAMPVSRYVAFRRVDDPPALTADVRTLHADNWVQVGTVDAFTEDIYHIEVPTIGDSTEALGQYYSHFFIRAATDEPAFFYDSSPDSGYSVDNLAPGIPGSLLYSSGELSWNESPAEDFDYFTVYGGPDAIFANATVVDYTIAPDFDATASPYTYYFVTATDFSGNEGAPISVNSASGVGGTPRSYVLSLANHPNPFNPRTTVSYTVPSRGTVTVTIYDARGALVATLVDNEARDAGAYRADWDGRTGAGLNVPSGVYFARIQHNDAVRSRKMVLLR